jgi:hypothetical protein
MLLLLLAAWKPGTAAASGYLLLLQQTTSSPTCRLVFEPIKRWVIIIGHQAERASELRSSKQNLQSLSPRSARLTGREREREPNQWTALHAQKNMMHVALTAQCLFCE